MMKLKTNQSFTKRPKTKIKNQKNKLKRKNKRKSIKFCMPDTNFEGRREKREGKKYIVGDKLCH